MDALQPFPTRQTSMRFPLYSTTECLLRNFFHFAAVFQALLIKRISGLVSLTVKRYPWIIVIFPKCSSAGASYLSGLPTKSTSFPSVAVRRLSSMGLDLENRTRSKDIHRTKAWLVSIG
jgi:hypothetical protein